MQPAYGNRTRQVSANAGGVVVQIQHSAHQDRRHGLSVNIHIPRLARGVVRRQGSGQEPAERVSVMMHGDHSVRRELAYLRGQLAPCQTRSVEVENSGYLPLLLVGAVVSASREVS